MANNNVQTARIQESVRQLVESTVTLHGGEASLFHWNETAVREKVVRDLPQVYPQAEATGPDNPFALYIPTMRVAVRVSTHAAKDIKVWQTTVPRSERAAYADSLLQEAREMLGKEVDALSEFYIPRDSNWITDVWVDTHCAEGVRDQLEDTQSFMKGLMESAISQPSMRDKQSIPGPSDLADSCDACVGRKIAKFLGIDVPQPRKNFSLKAWMGTATHEKTERDMPYVYPHGEHEITVPIAHVDGLGLIEGHVDMYLPRLGALCDWKTTDADKLLRYKESGVPENHVKQVMLYGYGLRNLGRDVDRVILTYIPRDSDRPSDASVHPFDYRQEVAEDVISRTKKLVKMVESHRMDELSSSRNCYVCTWLM